MTKEIIIDLGAGPWGDDCAQLGSAENFELINQAEIHLYRAALIAAYGPPADGIILRCKANAHDFGRYYTLEAVVDDTDVYLANNTYLEQLDAGIERWFHAGFAPPDFTSLARAADIAAVVTTAITGAIQSTRPMSDGTFFPPEFEHLQRNLRAAFPDACPSTPA